MIGRDGARIRYERIQWCMMLWRLLALVQIPVLIAICPARFSSTNYTWLIFGVALASAALYWWLAMHTKAGGNLYFHYADQAVCAVLMLVARDGALLSLLYFYSFASLISRPTQRSREAWPPVVGLSVAFLISASLTSGSYYSTSLALGDFVIFYLIGLALLGFSKLLDRTTELELDARLEEHRQGYRRRLHDDLGNTICGLHFKIQSLKQKGANNLGNAVGFLAQGYERASESLTRLLKDIEEIPDQSLADSLATIVMRAKADFDISVTASNPAIESKLSPEALKEVLYIIYEAITNAARHTQAREVRVDISRRRGVLTINISDHGPGFDESRLAEMQKAGSTGIKGMRERAKSLGGQLDISSDKASGTVVTLALRETDPRGVLRSLVNIFSVSDRGIYMLTIYIKFLIALGILMEAALMSPEMKNEALVWIITGAVCLDSAFSLLFSSPLYAILKKSSWPLVMEQVIFLILIFFAWHSGLPFFFDSAPTAGLILSACFLGISRNVGLASFLGLGMIAANQLAPPTASMHAERMEELVMEVISNLVVAICASLAVEFLKNLEKLKHGAVSRAVSRQREQINTRTYEELHSKVHALGADIKKLSAQLRHEQEFRDSIAGIEIRSTDLKVRLRNILRSLDEGDIACEPAATDPSVLTAG